MIRKMKNWRATGRPGSVRRLAAGSILAFAGFSWAELPDGLVLHFDFDSAGGGNRIEDRSGGRHHGQAVSVEWTETGRKGGAVEIGPAHSGIRVPHSPALAPSQATFAVWFRTGSTGSVRRTILEMNAPHGYALQIVDGPRETMRGRLRFTVGGESCVSDAAVNDGTWKHAAATFDGETLRLYLDGRLQRQTASAPGPIRADGRELVIGLNASDPRPGETGQSFGGRLDELMIFNRALSEPEIQALIEAAPPRFTREQIAQQLALLKDLFDRGLLTREFYERKVREYEEGL